MSYIGPGTNGYYYDNSQPVGQRVGFSLLYASNNRFLTDPFESKAFVDYADTGTIGSANSGHVDANGNIDNAQGGAITASEDDTYFGNGHSNEFDWGIQDLTTFYYTLENDFRLNPNP